MISGSTLRSSLMPRRASSGLSSPPGGDEGRRHLGELVLHVGVAALEGEPAALRLLHDADLDAADQRQALAVAHHLAIAGVRLEHDLRGAHVALEAKRTAAHRVRGRFVAVVLDRLARHRAREREREHVAEVEIRILQPDAQRVALRRLELRHALVEEGVRRAVLRIEEAPDRVGVVRRGELALRALECRVVGEVDAGLYSSGYTCGPVR